MPPAVFVAAAAGDVAGGGMAFFVPGAARVGDVLIAIGATHDNSTVTALIPAESDFEILANLELVPPATGRGQVWVGRHVITGSESGELALAMTSSPAKLAAVSLLYRNLNRVAPIVAGQTSNVVASTNFVCPSLALAAYSDLYLGISFVEAAVAVTQPAGALERFDGAGFGGCQLEVFELLLETPGATGTKIATTAGAQSGIAAAIALAAGAVLGFDKGISFDPPGAIGLPKDGI